MRKTTMQVAIIVLGLAYASPNLATVSTDEEFVTSVLEARVTSSYWFKYERPLKRRIEAFLIKHKVRRPAYYADIIDRENMSDAERKLFAAMLVLESRGKANAVSSEGAIGPWQQHPCWFKRYGRARHPRRNLTVCLDIYRIHKKEEKSLNRALVAYSGGSRHYAGVVLKMVTEI